MDRINRMKKDFQDESVERAKNRMAAPHHVMSKILLIPKNPVDPVHLIGCRLPVLRKPFLAARNAARSSRSCRSGYPANP